MLTFDHRCSCFMLDGSRTVPGVETLQPAESRPARVKAIFIKPVRDPYSPLEQFSFAIGQSASIRPRDWIVGGRRARERRFKGDQPTGKPIARP